MADHAGVLRQRVSHSTHLNDAFAALCATLGELGCEMVLYDYARTSYAADGLLATPSVLMGANIPIDMKHLWQDKGFYQIDPVQERALQSCAPFAWSYGSETGDTALSLAERHRPVVQFLDRFAMRRGVTAPVRGAAGGFATVTVVLPHASPWQDRHARAFLPQLGFLAAVFQDSVSPLLGASLAVSDVRPLLTRRQRDCLRLCAEGLTSKEMARAMACSVATVDLHLQAAARRLGARNRLHAVALAMREGVL
ncbi:DNA-binding HTH domain-containing protein [Ameyamaea chiangmaiensis NBRC 103196]|uniref:LuxR family transcriptional regulator n=1 Tax=Ameyamaea chiangmaiensis TaxID=442969 RepID=A0A850PEB3_9PROT|nr:LuxR family transcriptional regulator [Ameyamaea chiangmaiensis]MBS4075734.1 LuxR family transcriptional regulator [Ameyamaea chiangmaiensis]NVN40810.1 LuxR family transcriptional regulator [Ameyamaea chiangmaiensis]GBQ70347.1 DNA-binding HTH domain-containing protein [Ameyamaea chiangmaiensis NBRC 103196]